MSSPIFFRPCAPEALAHHFAVERHPAMERLMREICAHPWVGELAFDQSHLRLLVAKSSDLANNALLGYGDGRFGGRPVLPVEDIFDLTFPASANRAPLKRAPSALVIRALGEWATSD